ncbi:class I SAM-dependent methyltransferase [Massilia sp. CF038]|uniref:class I SAM-dependent methyltransferase n=1 Tax=Massilia sp. CF038 TaxID=1881045 RepID=UPI000916084F|nr:class I SAM-dependent methyltransferase [Massilia sp. CF038]SHH10380.1 DNA methylase [Massilia sp. CF038]
MITQLTDVSYSYNSSFKRLDSLESNGDWDLDDIVESKIHKIHSYPAKFPAFLATRALDYARREGITLKRVADIFCGCGTVAYEARREEVDFWGCDINPVATLIASVKSTFCDPEEFVRYRDLILANFELVDEETNFSLRRTNRLLYWFQIEQFRALARLRNSINISLPENSPFKDAFLCAFSAILKSTSQWRQRSTKPQLDPTKKPKDVLNEFLKQCSFMTSAWRASSQSNTAKTEIVNGNIIDVQAPAELMDMIITSPPYVTSYEYADLHQLSSLWLGYAEDYRDLRVGSIGSGVNAVDLRKELKNLNEVAYQIVFSLYGKNPLAAGAAARYYLDMQKVAKRCFSFLRPGGLAFFVIGDTTQNGVKLDNAAHLTESLMKSGFRKVLATKRTISNKLHTPYRENNGQFSQKKLSKMVYSEEYILIAHR